MKSEREAFSKKRHCRVPRPLLTRELWQAHMNAPHLAAYMQATDGAVAEFTLYEMNQID